MDWKLLLVTFGTVFLAELGDKTQVATFTLASGASARLPVFLGSAAALVATSAIAVLGADMLTRIVSPLWLSRGAGTLLIVMGAWMLLGRGAS